MEVFKFKSFDICQDREVMRINTDGVLLAAWVKPINSASILDVGSGTGVIALIMAQRFQNASIKAIDIDKHASELSALNFSNAPWSNRLESVYEDFKIFSKLIPPSSFDLIISNPPFFNNSTPSSQVAARRSKHTQTISHEEIIDISKMLLSPKGELAMVLPANEAEKNMEYAVGKGFFCRRKLFVYPDESKQLERILFQLTLSEHEFPEEHKRIFIRNAGTADFSKEYRSMTKDYYLNF
jgi:tRNA1Val (adenine37-N6)-methyltransferase